MFFQNNHKSKETVLITISGKLQFRLRSQFQSAWLEEDVLIFTKNKDPLSLCYLNVTIDCGSGWEYTIKHQNKCWQRMFLQKPWICWNLGTIVVFKLSFLRVGKRSSFAFLKYPFLFPQTQQEMPWHLVKTHFSISIKSVLSIKVLKGSFHRGIFQPKMWKWETALEIKTELNSPTRWNNVWDKLKTWELELVWSWDSPPRLHIHHQQHVKPNLSPPPPFVHQRPVFLSPWQPLKHSFCETRMRGAAWTKTVEGKETPRDTSTNKERETGGWEVSSHHTPSCLLVSNSLRGSLSTATVCLSCPGEHKATRLPLVLFVAACRQIAVHKVVTTSERKFIILLAGWCIYPQW